MANTHDKCRDARKYSKLTPRQLVDIRLPLSVFTLATDGMSTFMIHVNLSQCTSVYLIL